jgi:hypothetical protein
MRRIAVILSAVALLVAFASPVLAEEDAKYNFASAQGAKELEVIPGGESEGVIYFYNIDGNRITHITLEVSQAPENWQVEIDPPTHDIEVEVSGMPVTVTENLHAAPSELLLEEPAPGDVPEGMVSIKVPTRGYAFASPACIIVRVPESAEIGTTADIIIAAEAEWLGQGGAAAIKPARDFEFSVTVVSASTEFTETIVGEGGGTEATDAAAKPATWWWPAIIGGAVAAVVAGVVITRRRAAHRRG